MLYNIMIYEVAHKGLVRKAGCKTSALQSVTVVLVVAKEDFLAPPSVEPLGFA